MSKFLSIVGENLSNIDNPQAIFYLKLVDDKGNDIGYEPIQLRGTSYADDLFTKIKGLVGGESDINSETEEDDEIYMGAKVLGDIGDKPIADKLKRITDLAKIKRGKIDSGLNTYLNTLKN